MLKAILIVRKLPTEGDESMMRALTSCSEGGIDGYLDDKRRARVVSCNPPPYLTCQNLLNELKRLSSIPFEKECMRTRGRTRIDSSVELSVVGRQPRISRASTTGVSCFC